VTLIIGMFWAASPRRRRAPACCAAPGFSARHLPAVVDRAGRRHRGGDGRQAFISGKATGAVPPGGGGGAILALVTHAMIRRCRLIVLPVVGGS
jgi:hypothetical protein